MKSSSTMKSAEEEVDLGRAPGVPPVQRCFGGGAGDLICACKNPFLHKLSLSTSCPVRELGYSEIQQYLYYGVEPAGSAWTLLLTARAVVAIGRGQFGWGLDDVLVTNWSWRNARWIRPGGARQSSARFSDASRCKERALAHRLSSAHRKLTDPESLLSSVVRYYQEAQVPDTLSSNFTAPSLAAFGSIRQHDGPCSRPALEPSRAWLALAMDIPAILGISLSPARNTSCAELDARLRAIMIFLHHLRYSPPANMTYATVPKHIVPGIGVMCFPIEVPDLTALPPWEALIRHATANEAFTEAVHKPEWMDQGFYTHLFHLYDDVFVDIDQEGGRIALPQHALVMEYKMSPTTQRVIGGMASVLGGLIAVAVRAGEGSFN
ncbi:metalloprotease 1 [Colletotrichum salicis]|uniref:Metalloprotease 1 n=1 Tax=Colletotrichum salicis TaxID=1209931 RepID=A0A135TYN2_9PEZI|nr:metalloprotease 1 [Colletotrichum salicis]